MTTRPTMNADSIDPFRPLSQDELDTVSGGLKFLEDLRKGLNCFPIFEDDGRGGVIIISPTLGPLGRL
jgi:hypothetical protein